MPRPQNSLPKQGGLGWVSPSLNHRDSSLIHFYEENMVVTRIMSIFALYNVNKHSMLRQKRKKSKTGICHVMQGQESKTCPCDFLKYLNNQSSKPNSHVYKR